MNKLFYIKLKGSMAGYDKRKFKLYFEDVKEAIKFAEETKNEREASYEIEEIRNEE